MPALHGRRDEFLPLRQENDGATIPSFGPALRDDAEVCGVRGAQPVRFFVAARQPSLCE